MGRLYQFNFRNDASGDASGVSDFAAIAHSYGARQVNINKLFSPVTHFDKSRGFCELFKCR